MKTIVVNHACHQLNRDGKAVLTGVGVFIEGLSEPIEKITTSSEATYGELWLKAIIEVLRAFQKTNEIGKGDQVKFVTGFSYLVSMSNRVEKTLLQCIQSNVCTEEEVDYILYSRSRYQRKKNHDLYVALIVDCLVLLSSGVTVSFHLEPLRSKQCGSLWEHIRNQVEPNFSPKNAPL